MASSATNAQPEIPLHTANIEKILLERTSVEYGLRNKRIRDNGNKVKPNKKRLRVLRDLQRMGVMKTRENLNNTDLVVKSVQEIAAKKAKDGTPKDYTINQYVNFLVCLLWFVTPGEAGMTKEEIADLINRGYKKSKPLRGEYDTRRVNNEMSEYQKEKWISDWTAFEREVEAHLETYEPVVYDRQNPTCKEVYEYQQRLQQYANVKFYNVRSALRTVVLFTHPSCNPHQDNVLWWDDHVMYICWRKLKTLSTGGTFIQTITDPFKLKVRKYVERFGNNQLYMFPESHWKSMQKQDTYRDALQSQDQLVTGKRVPPSIMRSVQITHTYDGNLTPAEQQRLSREFRHSAHEHDLYVRKVPQETGRDQEEVEEMGDDLDSDDEDEIIKVGAIPPPELSGSPDFFDCDPSEIVFPDLEDLGLDTMDICEEFS
ncbi:hypothetical protein HK097_000422 [Rhizophlyctis rosea]|uniref:Uncharacterized protein n=1 Tax=Rhizophlyctis rosea TaxID=64517 RepID=A0AAD5SHE6_9FUNG|nr:hypothetical protein HK097_000422 [Rhizophlyctis rosea]